MLGSVRKHALGESAAPRPPRKPAEYRESKEQREVVRWMRARPNWLVMRLENAAKRTGAQYARDEAMGMEPGAPDLLVMIHTFWFYIEMKDPIKGKVSDVQEKLHKQLRARGSSVLIGWGSKATISTLEKIDTHWARYHECGSVRLVIQGLIEQGSIKNA